MKEYDVKITETLEKTVTVQAESHDAAEEQVRAAYYNSEYILDSENFTGVAFGTTEEREVQKEQADTMNVLLVKPFMYPQAVQIGCELEDLQKAVGGDIEATYPFNEPVALVMHDEGKLVGKELNRALRDDDGDIYDIIAGDFLVVGLGEDDFCSLSPELMKQFEEHFHQPETFVRMGRSIMALPLPDDMVKKEDAPVKADSVPTKVTLTEMFCKEVLMQRNSTIGELMERKRIQDGAKEYQGHTYMDLARFDDATKHMIIFDVLTDESPVGWKGERNRLYLSDVGYQKALDNQKAGNIKIISHAAVAKGNLYYDHRDMAR